MSIPAEHLPYLQQHGYTPRCPDEFSKEETALLHKYGHWLEALATGWIAPATPEQSHFLRVARGEAEPKTPFEHVWRKLSGQSDTSSHPASTDEHLPADAIPADEGTGSRLDQLAELRRYADEIHTRKEAERAAVLRTVQAQLEAIDAKYARPLAEADQAVAELEAEVKAEVLKVGKSLRQGPVQAVFFRGSVTWDSRGLTEYAQSNPALEQFRKIGSPRVVIKYRPVDGAST